MNILDLLQFLKIKTIVRLKIGRYTLQGKALNVYNSIVDLNLQNYNVDFVGLSKNIINIRASKEIQ